MGKKKKMITKRLNKKNNKSKLLNNLKSTSLFSTRGVLFILVFASIGVYALLRIFAETGFGPTSGRPFDSLSAWNKPIATNAPLDTYSANIVTNLASGTNPGVANIYNWGAPVYNAYANTPRYTFQDTSITVSWCTGKTNGVTDIPIPVGAKPSQGDAYAYDGAMVVIDWSKTPAYIYEFYDFQKSAPTGTTISAGCAIKRTTTEGEGNNTDLTTYASTGSRGGETTGSRVSRLAGVVEDWEFEALRNGSADKVNHALAFSTKWCKGSGGTGPFRYPALKSDGKYGTTEGYIEEGSRIQLDPSFDISSISDPVQRGIARTLQVYGAYAMDCGGSSMGFVFDGGIDSGATDPYRTAGWGQNSWGSQAMNAIPWSKLRVLKAWDCPTCSSGGSTGDTTKPTINVTAPSAGATVSGTTTLSAGASDDVDVTEVQFTVDGTNVGSADNSSPYSLSWDSKTISDGAHSIGATAKDAAGNLGSATTINITVSNTVVPKSTDTTAPNVSITNPLDGGVILSGNKTTAISATGSDNVGVSKMELYVDNSLKTSTTSSSLQWSWRTNKRDKGIHTITIKAYDAAGNIGSNTVIVTKY